MKSEIDPRYEALLRTVEKYCLAHEDPVLVDKYAHYYSEGYDAYGLTDEQVHELRDKVLSEHPLSCNEYAEAGWHLFATGKYEFGSIAVLTLETYKDSFDTTTFQWIKKWLDKGVENWAHTDNICTKLIAVLLEKEIISMQDFADWRTCESRWTRRAVPMSLMPLRKTAEPMALLDFIEPMITDKDRVVHQGLGWFLRELWKLHNTEVEDFLVKHKQDCDRLIMQYATEKMSDELKKRFRRDKPATQDRFKKNNNKPGNKQNNYPAIKPKPAHKPKPVNKPKPKPNRGNHE